MIVPKRFLMDYHVGHCRRRKRTKKRLKKRLIKCCKIGIRMITKMNILIWHWRILTVSDIWKRSMDDCHDENKCVFMFSSTFLVKIFNKKFYIVSYFVPYIVNVIILN